MNYYPWLDDDEDDSFAWIGRSPREMMDKEYRLADGVSALGWFPADVTYELDSNHGIKLTDALGNNLSLLFVAPRLRDLLGRVAPEASIEYLPVHVRNHKGKLVQPEYAIANVLDSVEYVNKEKSDYTMDQISKNQVSYFRRLVLDTGRIPPDKKVLRLAEKTNLVIVREDLAQEMVDSDITGVLFIRMEDYGAELRGRT